MSKASYEAIVCVDCGYADNMWTSYFCIRCGNHADLLFLKEHPHPESVVNWNRADIIAEYHSNGMPFAAPRGGA
jgi:anaerobic ribonucleoside-triphosphate reductase